MDSEAVSDADVDAAAHAARQSKSSQARYPAKLQVGAYKRPCAKYVSADILISRHARAVGVKCCPEHIMEVASVQLPYTESYLFGLAIAHLEGISCTTCWATWKACRSAFCITRVSVDEAAQNLSDFSTVMFAGQPREERA